MIFWYHFDFLSFLAVGCLVVGGYIAVDLLLGSRKMAHIGAVSPIFPKPAPLVSVIVPARDEGSTIEPALRSVLALDYAPLEIIVVNDRSTDATGAVVERVAQADPRLRVFEVKDLPRGWLGKNHALHLGAAQARGEYLLFTDADVVFETSVLTRAISRMVAEKLDHLLPWFSGCRSPVACSAC